MAEFVNRFPEVRALLLKSGQAAVQDVAEILLEEANRTVPIEEGTLERSGQVTSSSDDVTFRNMTSAGATIREGVQMSATVSYGTPYARVQHERTHYRHAAGRRAKWLQLTFQERSGDVGGWLAQRIRAGMGGGGLG